MGFKTNKHKGASSELIACSWLMDQGYEVFRNVCSHGPADLVAWRDGEILLIDVKSQLSSLTSEQMGMGVRRLVVMPDGECVLGGELKAISLASRINMIDIVTE